MQLHPYILNLIAEDRIAQMHARAESDRRARLARKRRAALRLVSRAEQSLRDDGRWMPAQPTFQEEKQLVSVGRTSFDDCL